MSDAVGE
ncbi:Protein of unknown function [Propionibacterium freudenreichii subsp. freudenreichii]|nr:Protein of unknown function [Propionibacterium freudenreichii]CEP26263.1 Protein of unknown function [Propionibacterium freudenreichii subsp. freudenreichii]CEG91205.1 Protein of unknown function [Propionibacterium freudenreichii]CEG92214.1 Protein of unknown function [Propionibacterium freudenreichii]CEG95883.1 Protein of unknown function [Propionibacterium freudenreichii]